MSAPPASSPGPFRLIPVVLVSTLLFGLLGSTVWLVVRVEALKSANTAMGASLDKVLGEVTRMRLEQSAGIQGPQGLLAKLRTYAPLLASSRITEPDFRSAQNEMESILVAFASLGTDAWGPIMARLAELRGDKDFDEVRWLFRAARRVDPKACIPLLQEVLLGRRLPSPRLRWQAAELLIDLDQQLAQNLLRQILVTETHRGVDPNRAQAYNGDLPDKAAMAQTGFSNFVLWYVRSGDPKMDETLLMVLGRAEHDVITIQECLKVLADRKCTRAVDQIQRIFKNPPQQNPVLLKHCVDALYKIQGEAARPFLEEAMRTTDVQSIADHIKHVLGIGN
ncbi:MAG TPA: hypothetical protein VF384_05480 [Planctomycetota bacterium]